MNWENNKTSIPYRFALNLSGKKSDKYVALSNLSIYSAIKNIKKSHKSNEFKILGLTWYK